MHNFVSINNIYTHDCSSPSTLEMINRTDYSDGTLKRLHNPLYETTPAEVSPIGNTPQTKGTEPTYEPIKLSSNHPKNGSRNPANRERTSSGKYSS